MLSIDYDILRLFSTAKRWAPEAAAMQLHARAAYIRVRFASLLKRQHIYAVKTRRMSGYQITEVGEEALSEARKNPVLRNPHPWINRVRAGIDTEGHELKLKGRAAIPAPEKPEMSYEMDLDAFVDAKRAGLLDELLDD